MDPNKLLHEILSIAGEVVDNEENYGEPLIELCRMTCDLDDWFLAGGYMPARWEREA